MHQDQSLLHKPQRKTEGTHGWFSQLHCKVQDQRMVIFFKLDLGCTHWLCGYYSSNSFHNSKDFFKGLHQLNGSRFSFSIWKNKHFSSRVYLSSLPTKQTCWSVNKLACWRGCVTCAIHHVHHDGDASWWLVLNAELESDHRCWMAVPSSGRGFIGVRSPPVPELWFCWSTPQSRTWPSTSIFLYLQHTALTSFKIFPNEFVSPKCFIECNIKSWREKSMLEFGELFICINIFFVQILSGELWIYRI